MKLLVLADIEEQRWKHGKGEADVVIACGNVKDDLVIEAAEAHGCERIFAVKGIGDSAAPFKDPIINLHLRTTVCNGIAFGGFNGACREKPNGPFLYVQDEVTEALADFRRVDVFIAHNSPRGIHDKKNDTNIGFEGFRAYMDRVQPEVVVHGFQQVNKDSTVGETAVSGVCGHRLIELRAT